MGLAADSDSGGLLVIPDDEDEASKITVTV
jgi:hypothetical protein